jgi:mRNA interferase MazF
MNKGEIWLVNLPSTDGHEQTGIRPVIVLADVAPDIVIIVPCTTNIQALRYPNTLEILPSKETGLTSVSIALIFQIRAIDKKRLSKKIGDIPKTMVNSIDKNLKRIFEM